MRTGKLVKRITALVLSFRGDAVLTTSFAVVAIKVASFGLAFVASLFYARLLGPYEYGLYAYVSSLASLLAIFVGLGFAQYLVREGARHPESVGWLRRWADKRVLGAGLLGALVLCSAGFFNSNEHLVWLFVLAAPLPLLSGLAGVRQALLRTCGIVIAGQWPQQLLAPLVIIAYVLVVGGGGELEIQGLMVASVVAASFPVLINQIQLQRAEHGGDHAFVSASVRAAFPFVWLGALYFLLSKIDMLIIGWLRGGTEVGIYTVASRAAEAVAFFMGAVNAVIAPKLAGLHKNSRQEELRLLVVRSSRQVLLLSFPVCLVLFVFAEPILNLLYGAEFVAGATVMRVLVLTQFVVISFGSVGTLLDMTGHERINMRYMMFCVLVNFVLSLLLVSLMGMLGGALSTLVSVLLARYLLWRKVRKILKVNPSGFA